MTIAKNMRTAITEDGTDFQGNLIKTCSTKEWFSREIIIIF